MPQANAHCADLSHAEIVSIAAASSIEFLEAAFRCYASHQIFAISRPDTSLEGLVGSVTPMSLPSPGRQGWVRLKYQIDKSPEPAQIVFTSGTEGHPKPIVLSHHNLGDTVERLNDVMQVTSEIREYIGVPVTYSFGLGRARAVAAAGGEMFLPERFDPAQVRSMLEAGEINAISAVPSLWAVLLSTPEVIGSAGKAVRWIEIGSQHMPVADKIEMCRLFPNARIVQHYGLTEASRSTFLVISDADDAAIASVGQGTGSVQTRIDAQGAIGIRGDHVAMGVLSSLGQIEPLADADGWLTTRDRGKIENGLLYFEGRLDNQINVSGIKLSAEGLEAEVTALVPSTAGTFAIGAMENDLRGQVVLLGIEAAADDLAEMIKAATAVALERRGVPAGGTLKPFTLDVLPRTGTDKVQRSRLRDAYLEGKSSPNAAPQSHTALAHTDLEPDQHKVAATWRKVMGDVPITPEQTFYDLGGDSLSSVQIGLVMEAANYDRAAIRATLEGQPLHDVARLTEGGVAGQGHSVAVLPDLTARNWALSMTRAVMVLSVLMSHWGPGLFKRLDLQQIEPVFHLIYRMGTPGFAMVFGIGVGLSMLPDFVQRRASVLRRTGNALKLVLLGMILLAVTRLVLNALLDVPFDGRRVAVSFYGVLGYYMLMLVSAPLWMSALSHLRHPVLILSFLAPAMWVLWQIAVVVLPSEVQGNLLEWPRLMGQAGYNIFKMTSVAAAGMAVGLWLSGHQDTRNAAKAMVAAGGWGMLICMLILLQFQGTGFLAHRGDAAYTSLAGLSFYGATAVFVLGGFLSATLVWNKLKSPARTALHVLIAIGGLALPIYVFHGLVIPVRDILQLLGLPGTIALILPLGAFLLGALYGGRRLYRAYAM